MQSFYGHSVFICMLSYDVYLKKTIIERIVDQMLHEEKDPSKKEK